MPNESLFMVMIDVHPESIENEFNAWYNDEHVPELLRVPGFLSGRRFRAIEGAPRYAAMYALTDVSALDEPLFHQARPAHPQSTPATKRMWPHVRNLRRGIYSEVARSQPEADADGTLSRHLLLLGLDLDSESDAAFADWCAKKHLPALASARGLTRARCFTLDAHSSDHQNPPGRGLLLYELAGAEAARDAEWLTDFPAPFSTRILYRQIYPA